MPRVPVYDGPQVMPGIVNPGRVQMPDAPNVGARQAQGLGQALQQSGDVAGRMAIAIKDRLDTDRIQAEMARFVAEDTDLTANSLLVRGQDALNPVDGRGFVDRQMEAYQKLASRYEDGLSDEAQKRRWRETIAPYQQRFGQRMAGHVRSQAQVVHEAGQNAEIQARTHRGITLNSDPAEVQESIAGIRAVTLQQLTERGLAGDENVVEAALRESLTPLHSGVLGAMIDGGRLDEAQSYMDQHSTGMSLQAKSNALKALEEATVIKKGQDIADRIRMGNPGDPTAQLAEARKLTGRERDTVVARINKMNAEDQAAERLLQSNAAQEAWKLADAGQFEQIPPSVLSSMDRKDRDALNRVMVSGVPEQSDVDKWLEFTNLPASTLARMTPQELRQRYWGHFSDADLRKANSILLSVKESATSGSGGNGAYTLMSKEQIIAKTAVDLGIAKPEGNKKRDAAYWDFHEKFDARVNAWQDNNPGKKPDNSVLKTIAAEMAADQIRVQIDWWKDSVVNATVSTPDQLKRAYVVVGDEEVMLSSIPETQKVVISNELRLQDRPVTQQAIANYWVKAGKPQ